MFTASLIVGMNSLPVNFLLVKVEKPTTAASNDPDKNWRDFWETLKSRNVILPAGTRTLPENLFLLHAADGIQWLGRSSEVAVYYAISLRVYFLEHEPDWLDLFDDGADFGVSR